MSPLNEKYSLAFSVSNQSGDYQLTIDAMRLIEKSHIISIYVSARTFVIFKLDFLQTSGYLVQ